MPQHSIDSLAGAGHVMGFLKIWQIVVVAEINDMPKEMRGIFIAMTINLGRRYLAPD